MEELSSELEILLSTSILFTYKLSSGWEFPLSTIEVLAEEIPSKSEFTLLLMYKLNGEIVVTFNVAITTTFTHTESCPYFFSE